MPRGHAPCGLGTHDTHQPRRTRDPAVGGVQHPTRGLRGRFAVRRAHRGGHARSHAGSHPEGHAGRDRDAERNRQRRAVRRIGLRGSRQLPQRAAGYRVAFPDDWWTNTEYEHEELGTIQPCRFFGPAPFDLDTATPDDSTPDGIAIVISHTTGCLGYINPLIDRRELTIGGYEARAEELAEGKRESNPPLLYQYVIDRLPDASCEGMPNGDHLIAVTRPDDIGDYEGNKDMLDRMMETIEVTEPESPPVP